VIPLERFLGMNEGLQIGSGSPVANPFPAPVFVVFRPAIQMSDKSCGAVILFFSFSLFAYYTFWVILSVFFLLLATNSFHPSL
jgi:hypothetical protein